MIVSHGRKIISIGRALKTAQAKHGLSSRSKSLNNSATEQNFISFYEAWAKTSPEHEKKAIFQRKRFRVYFAGDLLSEKSA